MSHDAHACAQARWEEFVVRTWYDRDLYRKALADPDFAMRAAGIETPPGTRVLVAEQGVGAKRVVGKSAALWTFVLSEPPVKLSEEDALKAEANLEQAEGACPTGGAGTAHVYERV